MAWKTLVASGTLVVRDAKVLLARTMHDGIAHWEVAAGHQEPGETLEQTAARHVADKTGIVVTPGALVCTYLLQDRAAELRILCAYFAGLERVPDVTPRPQGSQDIVEVAFVDPMQLAATEIHPVDHAILRRWWPERAWIAPFHLHFDR